MYTRLASAIVNDIYAGLSGLHHNISLSIEQLQDEIINLRLQVIKEYQLKGILPLKDLYIAINCIPTDCKELERCPICRPGMKTPNLHFEVPQILGDYIAYIGTIDRQNPFTFYMTSNFSSKLFLYRKRGKNRPYVYIDPTPNENNMYDGYIFGAPLLRMISIVAIFKDPRQIENFGCCQDLPENYNFIDIEVKNRLVQQKINYYRLLHMNNKPNDQLYE